MAVLQWLLCVDGAGRRGARVQGYVTPQMTHGRSQSGILYTSMQSTRVEQKYGDRVVWLRCNRALKVLQITVLGDNKILTSLVDETNEIHVTELLFYALVCNGQDVVYVCAYEALVFSTSWLTWSGQSDLVWLHLRVYIHILYTYIHTHTHTHTHTHIYIYIPQPYLPAPPSSTYSTILGAFPL